MLGDTDGQRWGSTEHLLATLADQQQQTNRLLAVQLGQGKRRPPKFEPHPRPGWTRKDAEVQRSTPAYLYLRQLRPGGEVAQGQALAGLVETLPPELKGRKRAAPAGPPVPPEGLPVPAPPRDAARRRTGPATWEDA